MERFDDEAMKALFKVYIKILKVNLTTDEYSIIKANDDELVEDKGFSNSISQWLINYAESGMIHRDDVSDFKKFTNIDTLKRYFADGEDRLTMHYRRVEFGHDFDWVMMELLKAEDYTDDNQTLFLYIKVLSDNFAAEIETYYELRHSCNYDSLTNVQNLYAYLRSNRVYETMKEKMPVGVVFADVNGLKIVNDTKGHDAGNDLILRFCDVLKRYFGAKNVFRLSGDEFVVLLLNVDKEDMQESFDAMCSELKESTAPIGAVGWDWKESPATIKEVAIVAEKFMYEDKAEFYKNNPDFKREIFERNYVAEQTAVVNFLAEAYSTVGVIDIPTDTYRMIKSDKKILEPNEGVLYSDHVKILKEKIMAEHSLKDFEPLCGVENLRKVLKDSDFASVKFDTTFGETRELTFRKVASDDNGYPVRVIFYSAKVSDYLLKKK